MLVLQTVSQDPAVGDRSIPSPCQESSGPQASGHRLRVAPSFLSASSDEDDEDDEDDDDEEEEDDDDDVVHDHDHDKKNNKIVYNSNSSNNNQTNSDCNNHGKDYS